MTGGYDGEAPLASTELLLEAAGAWTEAGPLPSPRYGLRAGSLASTVLYCIVLYCTVLPSPRYGLRAGSLATKVVVTGEHGAVTSRAANGTPRNFTVPRQGLY